MNLILYLLLIMICSQPIPSVLIEIPTKMKNVVYGGRAEI